MQDAPYREIPLRARDGSVRAVAKVSPEDYDWLTEHRWKLTAKGYAQRESHNGDRWTSVRMHRAIMRVPPGDERQVDHINRDKLDNRRENLRVVTDSEQRQNVPARGGSSPFRGVHNHRGKWHARVGQRHLGSYPTEAEAAAAARAGRMLLMPNSSD